MSHSQAVPDTGISRHGNILPNPDFVLSCVNPLGPVPTMTEPPSSAPSASTMRAVSSARREPATLSARRGSAHNLPNFVFNPSASSSALLPNTPPQSPHIKTPATPPRVIGHRRGGSEYVGGDGNGGGGLKSASPTKSEAALPVPSTAGRYGPPAGRRGHAHRRSAAMSSHDLSDIVNPQDQPPLPPPVRHGSAPVSPVESFWSSSSAGQESESLSSVVSASPPSVSKEPDSPNSRVVPRVRVGFSERVEYIRPLSTISSETESSISTIRHGGHSVSGSFSSILSAGSPSPQSNRVARGSLQAAFEEIPPASRPNTADPLFTNNRESDIVGGHDPLSSSVTTPECLPVHLPQSSSTSKQPQLSPLTEKSTPAKKKLRSLLSHRRSESSLSPTVATFSDAGVRIGDDEITSAPTSENGNGSIKQAKPKTWSGLMSRKAKSQEFRTKGEIKPRINSTEDAITDSPEQSPCSAENFTPDFDEDNTITIVSDSTLSRRRMISVAENMRSVISDIENADNDSGAVIDLDAIGNSTLLAAGTPTGSVRPATGFASARKRMRSGGGVLSHSTSLDRLHRRAESAPEMVPFEAKHSMTAMNSPMADVFEEDEEGDSAAMKKPSEAFTKSSTEHAARPATAPSKELCNNVNLPDGNNNHTLRSGNSAVGPRMNGQGRESRPTGLVEARQIVSEPIFSGGNYGNIISAVEVVEDHEEPRAGSINRSSDSTISAPKNDDIVKKPDGSVDLTISVPAPSLMTPDSFTASSFSSPDFTRSQASFDTPRLGTAASSLTEHRVPGMPYDGIGELRMSTDDVPSLTSSRSTATTGVRNSLPTLRSRYMEDQRSSKSYSQSVSSEQRSKRSSIASLSRLVSGSFAEKSKLSIEQSTQQSEQQQQQQGQQDNEAEPVKQAKIKRTKRLSRLMGFWKSKERLRQ